MNLSSYCRVDTVCGCAPSKKSGTHSKQTAMLLATVASVREELSLQPDQRPVERNQEHQHYELDYGKTCTHAHQIACGEIAVGVTDDQHAGLIGEQLATGRKRPDHAEQQRMHAVGFCKFHHQRDGCAQHGNLAGQQEMIEEGGPV